MRGADLLSSTHDPGWEEDSHKGWLGSSSDLVALAQLDESSTIQPAVMEMVDVLLEAGAAGLLQTVGN